MIILQEELQKSLQSTRRVGGFTHNFYRYPARFTPEFTSEVIREFSKEGDYVLDAFMGGGTTIVEAIASGRNAIGIDINPLAYFIAKVKTTPLSTRNQESILYWAHRMNFHEIADKRLALTDSRLRNMPESLENLFIHAVSTVSQLEFPRQRRFARCVLLRLGQWAIDCRQDVPSPSHMNIQLVRQVNEMLNGLNDFIEAAKNQGIPKNKITDRRGLYLGTIHEAMRNKSFTRFYAKPKLVMTSPPYPGVHVLYHRWQVYGRRETPAPYWLANLSDGHGESFYTLGGRSASGLKNYFTKLTDTFCDIRQFINPKALVVQLVGFSDPDIQLPAFLNSMQLAGYEELKLSGSSDWQRPSREVPNRKWYIYSGSTQYASNEILLIHRPRN
ncbi:hypothetical protein ES703_45692 [subsurface metagenome]